ncbi:MAG: hypothetical protein ACP5H2_07475 [Solirubrobacteraceae bacterium]
MTSLGPTVTWRVPVNVATVDRSTLPVGVAERYGPGWRSGVRAGVPVHVMAARLGDHPQTLLGTYAHLLPHSDAAAAAAIVDKPLTTAL